MFPLNNGGLVTEIRYLADGKNKESDIKVYVQELLLGPQNHRGMNLLTPGTKINNIFVREDVLYVDFKGFFDQYSLISQNNCPLPPSS